MTITLTPNAQTQLKKICAKEQGNGLYINIKTTGCSGYAYDLSVIPTPHEEDIVFPQEQNLFVAIAPKNLPLVDGSVIDYVREGLNAHFKFINPHEKNVCGCGESFSV